MLPMEVKDDYDLNGNPFIFFSVGDNLTSLLKLNLTYNYVSIIRILIIIKQKNGFTEVKMHK